jgi:hypothetical protein
VELRNLSKGTPPEVAYLEDISPGGVRLRTQSPVEIGDAVSCERNDLLLMGEVVHCEEADNWRTAGIELIHDLDENSFGSNRPVLE